MKIAAANKASGRIRRVSMSFAASAIVAGAVHANPSSSIVLVPPANLPPLAQQGGEAMLLNDAIDGRTLLYVEQNQGARLAVFDVTDPSRIKGKGFVQLDAAGPFDFVSPLGNQAELLRYRQGDRDAVLDLHREDTPRIVPATPDYQLVESANSPQPGGVVDGMQVRAQMTKADTGTTFLLTDKGLYVIRRPGVETVHQVLMITPN